MMLRKFNLLVVLTLCMSAFVYGQGTGTVKGVVKDAESGELLPFVTIQIEQNGVSKGSTQSDFDGNYTFSSLPPGAYTIKAIEAEHQSLMIKGVVVSSDQITFQNLEMSASDAATIMEEFEVKEYAVPLIKRDGGSSGGTMTREDIDKMPGRSATAIATTVGGVYQDAGGGGGISVRGSRSDATYYFIDGIKVRGSTNLPKAAIEEVSVITGGLPANYGDATGGVISITTRGPSSFYFGGIDILSSGFAFGGDDLGYGRKVIGLDRYAYNLVEGSISGPLLMKKDTAGKKTEPLIGFFLSANINHQLDARPAYGGYQRIRKDVRDSILNPESLGPLRPLGSGAVYNVSYLQDDDFENVAWADNAGFLRYSAAGKIDVNAGPTMNLTFGGQFSMSDYSGFNYTNSLFNWENNADITDRTWRAYGRFTQRFANSGEDQGLLKNAFYSLMFDYSNQSTTVQDDRHGDNIFNYGYVGKFTTYREKSYDESYSSDGSYLQREHNGFNDTLVVYEANQLNPALSSVTTQYYSLYDEVEGNYENLNQILGGNALRNGDLPQSVYGLWNNMGLYTNGYSKSDNDQFRVSGRGSAGIGDHQVSIGFEFEKRTDRFFAANAYVGNGSIWSIGRQLANNHILELDVDNPMYSYYGTYQQIDYNRLNASPGEYEGGGAQAFFDYNLRNTLGLDPDGTDFIDLDAIDPSLLGLEMFSADELLNAGNNLVNYYGYDYTGQKKNNGVSFNDFFNKTDDFGNFTRDIGAFEPIYMAGYIMDKFAFEDLIFNVGLRVDRFDANQQVLKDPWLLYEAKTVGEVSEINSNSVSHPENMESDYIVYVNDINNPTGINGYRRNNGDGTSTWFNAEGIEIADPSVIETGAGIAPYLIGDPNEDIKSSAFEDYKAAINVMPRIAFSFPINEEALFFAHYDVLTKRPTTGNRFDILDYYFMRNRNVVVNNPNLRPEKTIDYELGFQQVLSKSSSLKIAAFYREMRDQVAVVNMSGAYPRTYRSWGNIDFGTVKGMTIAYDLRRTGNIWMRASYTLQFAEGTGSDAGSSLNLVNSGQPNLRTIYPFNYDQRHAIVTTIDYRYGEGKDYNGPVWFGKQVFKNTGLNFVTNIGSGTPYSAQSNFTPEANISGSNGVLQGQINGSRKPGQFRMDAQLDKNIELSFGGEGDKAKKANMNIYLLVNNVFNTRNIVNVYRATGTPDDDGFLDAAVAQTTIETQIDEAAYRNMYNYKVNNPFNLGIPRTIRLGLRVDF